MSVFFLICLPVCFSLFCLPLQSDSMSNLPLSNLPFGKKKPVKGDVEFDQSPEDNLSFHLHLIAGAIAGVTEHCSIFPLDTIKTRIQTSSIIPPSKNLSPSATIKQVASRIANAEGAHKLFRGVTAIAVGVSPAHAVYFAMYSARGAERPWGTKTTPWPTPWMEWRPLWEAI